MKIFKLFCLVLIILGFSMVSCTDILEPVDDNHLTLERANIDPAFAEGFLMNAYLKIPGAYSFNDVATDDAVTNDKFNSYLRIATGQWSAIYNPMSNWNEVNEAILYINLYLPIIDEIYFKWDNENVDKMFRDRMKGESYALMGLFRLSLLQNVAGKSASGQMLGIPLYDEFSSTATGYDIPRASFAESVAAINDDFNKAMALLPMDFKDITNVALLPAAYSNFLTGEYNLVFGNVSAQRISKRVVMGLKARLALLAASPAYSDNDQTLWVNAATAAADVLNNINGISGLDAVGHRFYEGARVDAVTVAADQKEILWRGPSNTTSITIERNMLPPGLNGLGIVNPSQNLVDVFPMRDGYPISVSATYNASNPYASRDPRLALYIIANGATIQSKVIKTGVGGGVNAKDSLPTSTRTGYYLRKLIREDIVLSNTGTATGKKHYMARIRYTEMFLAYAEAANEAWGPDGKGSNAYSAKDVIREIRKRAGINQPDAYLNSIATTADMRTLIRNERRIELCFEGFRFWDMRRWGLNLTEPAKGVNISGTNYQVVDVESRIYQPFMQYAPLPQTEVLKYPALLQNAGW